MRNLIVDVPDEFTNYRLFEDKLYEYLSKQQKTLDNYIILYRQDNPTKEMIKELAKKCDFRTAPYFPVDDEGMTKAKMVEFMAQEADEALIFYDYGLNDTGTQVMIDFCSREHVCLKVCRMDFGNKLY